MQSPAQICNIALGRVGCQFFINSIDPPDVSQEARVCAMVYNYVLEKALQDFPWPFANKVVLLQDIGSPLAPWGYRYRYPGDCLTLKRVFPDGGVPVYGVASKTAGVPYRTVSDDTSDARSILCDYSQVYADYTARVTNPNLFPPAFVNLLAWGIAAEIATPLSADPKYAQSAAATYKNVLAEAGALSANENQQDPEGDCDLDAARNT